MSNPSKKVDLGNFECDVAECENSSVEKLSLITLILVFGIISEMLKLQQTIR